VEYHFVDQAEYDAMVAAGDLLEHAVYAGNAYGTPRRPVLDKLAAGVPALLEIELALKSAGLLRRKPAGGDLARTSLPRIDTASPRS